MACAICDVRKEKRFCPAVHGRICPTCCGTEREVTLDCPGTCPYLQQARRNDRPHDLSEDERLALLPEVNVSPHVSQMREPLIVALGYAIAQAARRDRSLLDRDIVATLTGLAKSYQTAIGSGLVYDAPMNTTLQEALAGQLRRMIADYHQSEAKLGRRTATDTEVLEIIVFLLRYAVGRSSRRPRSRAFLDTMQEGFPQQDSVLVSPQDPRSKLIIP